MGGRLRRRPIDFHCKKNITSKEEYLKKYKVYKYEKSLPRCMVLDLCDRCGINWLASFVHINCTSLVGRRIMEKGYHDIKTSTGRVKCM